VTRRLTTDEIHAVLDNLTEDDMDRARASLARDAARRDAAVTADAPVGLSLIVAGRQPAFDAVYSYLSSSNRVPGDIATRNAMIWQGVNAALDAIRPAEPDSADLAEARRINAEAQQVIDMQRDLIGTLRQPVVNAMGHREDEGITEEACTNCYRDHMADLEAAVRAAEKRLGQTFPATADGPSRPGRIPGVEPTVTVTMPASAHAALRVALGGAA
jgi:hypothetical protein